MSHAGCCPELYYPHPGSMRSDAVIVGLGELEMAIVDRHVRERNATAAARGSKHRFNWGERADADQFDKQHAAVAGELAVAIWMGLEWTGARHVPKIPDVGWMYEVRHSIALRHSLILHRDDHGIAIYVDGAPPVLIIRGWLDVSDGLQPEYWRPDVPFPAFMVPQADLHNLKQLARGTLARSEVVGLATR